MFEHLKRKAVEAAYKVLSHRVIYGGLSACHGMAALITDKPEVYWPIAALYSLLVVRG